MGCSNDDSWMCAVAMLAGPGVRASRNSRCSEVDRKPTASSCPSPVNSAAKDVGYETLREVRDQHVVAPATATVTESSSRLTVAGAPLTVVDQCFDVIFASQVHS